MNAEEIWKHMEDLLVEECGLMTDEGLEAQRSNLINIITNGRPDPELIKAAISFLRSGTLMKVTVRGKRMTRAEVADALTSPEDQQQ